MTMTTMTIMMFALFDCGALTDTTSDVVSVADSQTVTDTADTEAFSTSNVSTNSVSTADSVIESMSSTAAVRPKRQSMALAVNADMRQDSDDVRRLSSFLLTY